MPLRAWTPSPPPGARRSTSRTRSRSPSRRNDRQQAGLNEQHEDPSERMGEREWDRDKHFDGQGEGERTPPTRRDRRAGTEGRYFSPGERRRSTGGRGEKSDGRREGEPRWAETSPEHDRWAPQSGHRRSRGRPLLRDDGWSRLQNNPGPPLPAPPTKVSFADASLPPGAYLAQQLPPPERVVYLLRLVLPNPNLATALIGRGGDVQHDLVNRANLPLLAVEGGRNRYVDLVGSKHSIRIGVRLINEVLATYPNFRDGDLRYDERELQVWPHAWLEDRYVDASATLPAPDEPLLPGTFVRTSSPLPRPETQLHRYYLVFPWRGVGEALSSHFAYTLSRIPGLRHLSLERTERGRALAALLFGTEAAIRTAVREVENRVYGEMWDGWEEMASKVLKRRTWVQYSEGQCVPQRGLWVKEDEKDDGGERAMDVDDDEPLTSAAPPASTLSALPTPSNRVKLATLDGTSRRSNAKADDSVLHTVEQPKPLHSSTPVYSGGGEGRSPPLSPAVSFPGGASPAQTYYHDDSGFGRAASLSPAFSPTSAKYSPISPQARLSPASPASIAFSPSSPRFSPDPPDYSPTAPFLSPTSPAYSPISPVYSNPSPRLPSPYPPAFDTFTPRFPAFTPSFPPSTLAPAPAPALPSATLLQLRAEVEASRGEKRRSVVTSAQAEAEGLRKRLEAMKKAREAERGRGAREGGVEEAGEREGRSSRRRDGREERDGRERGREGRDEGRRSGARRERRSRSRSRSPRRDRERERERDRGEDGRKKRSGRKAEEEPEEELVQEIDLPPSATSLFLHPSTAIAFIESTTSASVVLVSRAAAAVLRLTALGESAMRQARELVEMTVGKVEEGWKATTRAVERRERARETSDGLRRSTRDGERARSTRSRSRSPPRHRPSDHSHRTHHDHPQSERVDRGSASPPPTRSRRRPRSPSPIPPRQGPSRSQVSAHGSSSRDARQIKRARESLGGGWAWAAGEGEKRRRVDDDEEEEERQRRERRRRRFG